MLSIAVCLSTACKNRLHRIDTKQQAERWHCLRLASVSHRLKVRIPARCTSFSSHPLFVTAFPFSQIARKEDAQEHLPSAARTTTQAEQRWNSHALLEVFETPPTAQPPQSAHIESMTRLLAQSLHRRLACRCSTGPIGSHTLWQRLPSQLERSVSYSTSWCQHWCPAKLP